MKIYDAHIHIPGRKGEVFWEVSRPFRNMEELIKGLDRWGISRGVICSTVSTSAKTIEDFIRGNREVLQTLKDYPDRFWGACIVNPKFLKEALDELETCRNEFGFQWLGEMCPYLCDYSATSEEMFKVIEKATSLGYIVQVHSSTEEVGKLTAKFPETTFVFPHLPNLGECKGRFEFIAHHNESYLDISGSEIVRYGNLELAIETIGIDRILFGSDLTIDNPVPTIARVKDLEISRRDKEKIFWRNLDDLLKKNRN